MIPTEAEERRERPMKTVTDTQLAQNLGSILDRLEHEGGEVVIVRNRRRIARLVPDTPGMTAGEAFADLYGILPEGEGDAWLRDAREMDRPLDKELRDPWE
jgi:antitoxin (DNA-binding transcriptional repressor) of toxin-antitoxin stability system